MSGSNSNNVVMNSLSERLAATLSETSFDLEYANGKRKSVTKRGLTASELAEVCHDQDHGIVSKRAYVRCTRGHNVAIGRGTTECLRAFH